MSTHTPRPLRLVTSSATSTPTTDVFSSPSPPSSFCHSKRYSMTAAMTFSSPVSNRTAQSKAARRQSSIVYFPPNSTESPRRGSLVRRNSLGELNKGMALADVGEGPWTRAGDRRSTMSLPASSMLGTDTAPGTPMRERPPLTLTEKCVLLYFERHEQLYSCHCRFLQERRSPPAYCTEGIQMPRTQVSTRHTRSRTCSVCVCRAPACSTLLTYPSCIYSIFLSETPVGAYCEQRSRARTLLRAS